MLVHVCKLLVLCDWGLAMLNNITFYNIITLFVNTLMRTLCPTLVYAKACR